MRWENIEIIIQLFAMTQKTFLFFNRFQVLVNSFDIGLNLWTILNLITVFLKLLDFNGVIDYKFVCKCKWSSNSLRVLKFDKNSHNFWQITLNQIKLLKQWHLDNRLRLLIIFQLRIVFLQIFALISILFFVFSTKLNHILSGQWFQNLGVQLKHNFFVKKQKCLDFEFL